MTDGPVEDLDLFMMCRELRPGALGELPAGFHYRACREDELSVWMDFPFDTEEEARAYRPFMESFYARAHSPHRRDLFACAPRVHPVEPEF